MKNILIGVLATLGTLALIWVFLIRPETTRLRESYVEEPQLEQSPVINSDATDSLNVEVSESAYTYIEKNNHPLTETNTPELLSSPADGTVTREDIRILSIDKLINDVSLAANLSNGERKVVSEVMNTKFEADEISSKRINEISNTDDNFRLIRSAESNLTQEERSKRQEITQEIDAELSSFETNRKSYEDSLRNTLSPEKIESLRDFDAKRIKLKRDQRIKTIADGILSSNINISDQQKNELDQISKRYLNADIVDIPLGASIVDSASLGATEHLIKLTQPFNEEFFSVLSPNQLKELYSR